MAISVGVSKAHGLKGELVEPDWPRLTLGEVDAVLRRFPAAGGARRLISYSPRPFSAGSLVETPLGRVFVKRHARAVRDRAGLLEEHRFMVYLKSRCDLVAPVLADRGGDTAIEIGEWTYEVHGLARGVDVYAEALSWTPFLTAGHARAAGLAMAKLHRAAEGYVAPAREARQLVSSFTIFAGGESPFESMESYLDLRPLLRSYAEERDWRRSFDDLLIPLYRKLEPWLRYLTPLWTQNDFHASNLMWSGAGEDASVTGAIDFGLADRTNRVHDLATAIERNCVEWLRMEEPGVELVHLDHLTALLAGYEELAPLSYEEGQALVGMLPLVHCEFALSETDYFLSVLGSREKAFLAYEGYFLGHARWFGSEQGQGLLEYLERWAESRNGVRV